MEKKILTDRKKGGFNSVIMIKMEKLLLLFV